MAIEWRTKRFVSALARLHPRKEEAEARGSFREAASLFLSSPFPSSSPNEGARRAAYLLIRSLGEKRLFYRAAAPLGELEQGLSSAVLSRSLATSANLVLLDRSHFRFQTDRFPPLAYPREKWTDVELIEFSPSFPVDVTFAEISAIIRART